MSQFKATRRCAFITHERYFWHQQGNINSHLFHGIDEAKGKFVQPWQNFESAESKRRAWNLIQAANIDDELVVLKPVSLLVHATCKLGI